MSKKWKAWVRPVQCKCSRCGQVSYVEPGKEHNFCRGFKTVKPLPAIFAGLQGKVKGTWMETNVTIPIEASVPVQQPEEIAEKMSA